MLDGFTLFDRGDVKGWQLSTREKDQWGWSIRLLDEWEARVLLAMLEPPQGEKLVTNDIDEGLATPEEIVAELLRVRGQRDLFYEQRNRAEANRDALLIEVKRLASALEEKPAVRKSAAVEDSGEKPARGRGRKAAPAEPPPPAQGDLEETLAGL